MVLDHGNGLESMGNPAGTEVFFLGTSCFRAITGWFFTRLRGLSLRPTGSFHNIKIDLKPTIFTSWGWQERTISRSLPLLLWSLILEVYPYIESRSLPLLLLALSQRLFQRWDPMSMPHGLFIAPDAVVLLLSIICRCIFSSFSTMADECLQSNQTVT